MTEGSDTAAIHLRLTMFFELDFEWKNETTDKKMQHGTFYSDTSMKLIS